MKKTYLIIVIASLLIASCSSDKQMRKTSGELDKIAEGYIRLAFGLGKFDPDYVDAYFGPDSLKRQSESANLSLQQIISESDSLLSVFKNLKTEDISPGEKMRTRNLVRLITALKSRAQFINGKKMTFDEESEAFYTIRGKKYEFEDFDVIIKSLDSLIPGNGDLTERFLNYRKRFIIPPDKLDKVFSAAIKECRRRTLEHIQLPDGESFKVEYIKNVSWAAYNWFKGNSYSLIQVNTDMPVYIDRAIDLAAHEGYPGHHVFHSLIEKTIVMDSGWIEYSIYPLFSPISFLSEGLANYGIRIVFSEEERRQFERDVLFPLAGINPAEVERYYKIMSLVKETENAGIEIARRYLDGSIDRDQAIKLTMKYRLRTAQHAETNIKFVEKYRSYVINYSLGEETVDNFFKTMLKGGSSAQRWEFYRELITKPLMPEDLL